MSSHTNFLHRDAALNRGLTKRWCVLAEARLAYLTELFETGRWRRFHSEVEFLENIQEAKEAVDRWRAMAAGQPVSAGSSSGVLYQAPQKALAARDMPVSSLPVSSVPVATMPEADDAPVLIPIEKLLRRAPPRNFAQRTAPFDEATLMPADPDWKIALDPVSIEERYPMLRAAM